VLIHVASITVDAQGRLTAASSGSAGGGAFVPVVLSKGPTSGTYTATPGASQNFNICSWRRRRRRRRQRSEGSKVEDQVEKLYGELTLAPIAAPFSQPFSVGAGGNGGGRSNPGNQPGVAGNTGGATSLATIFNVNGGVGGNGAFSSGGKCRCCWNWIHFSN
jgi:hypothetical protein